MKSDEIRFDSVDEVLGAYQNEQIDIALLHSLRQIQHTQRKRFTLFHLFPREFVLSAASILVALFTGAFFSFQMVSLSASEQSQHIDYLEEISLTSLMDFEETL